MAKLKIYPPPPNIAYLCSIRDRMLANGDTNPHHWRELAKRFFYAGAVSNAQQCLERAEHYSATSGQLPYHLQYLS
jgi:hypothetical protein